MLVVINLTAEIVYYLDSLGVNVGQCLEMRKLFDTAINIYHANKGTKVSKIKFSNIKWMKIKCLIQDNGSDCGYYVLRFMREILLCSQEGVIQHAYFPTYRFEKYSPEQIEEVKQEWCRYIFENIISK
ncbi:Ulp1 protease family, C-terminal catalytic domain [Sesbania bispinosa]|nr:Ulp1 protease family, C-terminal catalytic domain [Sesbania bispinosa]